MLSQCGSGSLRGLFSYHLCCIKMLLQVEAPTFKGLRGEKLEGCRGAQCQGNHTTEMHSVYCHPAATPVLNAGVVQTSYASGKSERFCHLPGGRRGFNCYNSDCGSEIAVHNTTGFVLNWSFLSCQR